jgi:hypothetical protein
MVISNKDRFPDIVMGGQVMARHGSKSPGLLFYNGQGELDWSSIARVSARNAGVT